MRLSVTIMAHPSRIEHARDTVKKLKEDSPDTGFGIVVDENGDGVWHTAQAAWRHRVDDTATHHLVLQDDLGVCRDLVKGVEAALEHVPPKTPVSLFSRWKFIEQAHARNSSWAACKTNATACATVLPVDLIEEWIEWSICNVPKEVIHDDERLDMWCYETDAVTWITVPSLVEHLGSDRSLVKRENGRVSKGDRLATRYIGDDRSALEIDFSAIGKGKYAPRFPGLPRKRYLKKLHGRHGAHGIEVAVTIMAHRSRAEHAEKTRKEILHGEPEVSCVIMYDDRELGVWPNATAAWTRPLPEGTSHHLVLQDDVELCGDFMKTVRAAILAAPMGRESILNLFSQWSYVEAAQKKGKPWIACSTNGSGQGIVMPVGEVGEWLDWVDGHILADVRSYDARVDAWCLETGRLQLITVPSLVEHLDGQASLMVRDDGKVDRRPRVARRFHGPGSGLEINWAVDEAPHRPAPNDSGVYANMMIHTVSTATVSTAYGGVGAVVETPTGTLASKVLKLGQIAPYPDNPRRNEAAVDAVKRSILAYGYNQPIVVDERHTIIAGHTRYEALRQLVEEGNDQYREVGVIVSSLEEGHVRRARIADNRVGQNSAWDVGRLRGEIRHASADDAVRDFFSEKDLQRILDSEVAGRPRGVTPKEIEARQAHLTNAHTNNLHNYSREMIDLTCIHCGSGFGLRRENALSNLKADTSRKKNAETYDLRESEDS